MENLYQNEFTVISISNKILSLKIIRPVIIDLEFAVRITEDRLRLQKDKIYPVLYDLNLAIAVDKPARDYLALYSPILCSCAAIFANSNVSKTIFQFYKKVSKPKVKTEIFSEQSKAVVFLQHCH